MSRRRSSARMESRLRSVSAGSIDLPQEMRYALEVNSEITSRAMKSAALAARRPEGSPESLGRKESGPVSASKEELNAISLPIKGYTVVAKLGQVRPMVRALLTAVMSAISSYRRVVHRRCVSGSRT